MIICPFCRREITNEPVEEEFFCKYCENKIIKAKLSVTGITENLKQEPEKKVPENNYIPDAPSVLSYDLNNLTPALPPAVAPIAACAFSGLLLVNRFVLNKLIPDERIIHLYYTISFSGLITSFLSGIDEYSKRLNQKNIQLMEQILIDIKYSDFVSAREKTEKLKPRFGMNHSCKVRWNTAKSLLNMIEDRFESRIRVPETGDKSMVKCPFCHTPIAFVHEPYFFCTHCKALITNGVRNIDGRESYYWPPEYNSDSRSKVKKFKRFLLGTSKIGMAFISALLFAAGVPRFYKNTIMSLLLMVAGGVGFILTISNDPEYKPIKFGLGSSGLERLNSRIINYMLDGDYTSARDFIDALEILSSARDDNFIRLKTTKYILESLVNRLDNGEIPESLKSD